MTVAGIHSEFSEIIDSHDRGRDNLIPILQDVQDRYGYISESALYTVAEYLDLSANDVYGVATFYSQFRFTPPGEHQIKVCQGTACHVRGSRLITEELSRKLGIEPGQTTGDQKFSLERVACFGCCALAPAVDIDGRIHGRQSPRKVARLLEGLA